MKKVNKWTYIALAFLVGGVGAHKFYAGQVGMGLIYLAIFILSCGIGIAITAFMALADCITAISKTADANGMIEV